eukprot:2618263-Ditylum_brightwellii.AAC.1
MEQILEINHLVNHFHTGINMILQDCHYIGSFPLIQIDRNATYNDGDFERHQEEQHQKVVQAFKLTHLKVKSQ